MPEVTLSEIKRLGKILYTKEWKKKNSKWNKAYYKNYYKKNKNKQHDQRLQRTYGITAEEYEALLEKQNNQCGCCGIKSEERLAVDHCHDTGEIRGLLCKNCNMGIGKLGDNLEGLMKAVAYLKGD